MPERPERSELSRRRGRLLTWLCCLATTSGGTLVGYACEGASTPPATPPAHEAPTLRRAGGPSTRAAAPGTTTTAPPAATTPVTTTATAPPVTTAVTSTMPAPPTRAERVAWFALAQVGKPYVFGTAGPDTFDCSGLTRAALARVGVDVPHHAAWQARHGTPVRPDQVRPGDLVFTAGGRPRHDLGHVGIAVSATEWVDAPAPGRRVERAPIPFERVQAVRRLVGR